MGCHQYGSPFFICYTQVPGPGPEYNIVIPPIYSFTSFSKASALRNEWL
jgi:hypothetical protein